MATRIDTRILPDRGTSSRILSFTAGATIAAVLLVGCAGIMPGSAPSIGMAAAFDELAGSVVRAHRGGRDIAVLGFRERDGKKTPKSAVLDEFLMSALLTSGAPVAVGVGMAASDDDASATWREDSPLPERQSEARAEGELLSGVLYYESPWVYARVMLTEAESGVALESWSLRLSERELERQGELLAEREEEVSAHSPVVVSVDLHVVARRDENGLVEWVDLQEGGSLQPGDRIQLRYRVHTDCTVYAILYQSDGEREEVAPIQVNYPGRLYYAPGEFSWITVSEENEVYTLYFIAADELEEDRADLFDNMQELVTRSQLNRFSGLGLLDRVVAEYLTRTEAGNIEVLRGGREDIEKGKEEQFIFSDGESMASSPEKLSASPVLVRALSFGVQYQ